MKSSSSIPNNLIKKRSFKQLEHLVFDTEFFPDNVKSH